MEPYMHAPKNFSALLSEISSVRVALLALQSTASLACPQNIGCLQRLIDASSSQLDVLESIASECAASKPNQRRKYSQSIVIRRAHIVLSFDEPPSYSNFQIQDIFLYNNLHEYQHILIPHNL